MVNYATKVLLSSRLNKFFPLNFGLIVANVNKKSEGKITSRSLGKSFVVFNGIISAT